MKIIPIGEARVIMNNPYSRHNYFGWPTVAKLQNGKIAVVASGFRCRHVCPFGKTVIAYSENNGESYTPPSPVIDTVLDDRDGGIIPFGEKGVIVTSFNNTTDFQRSNSELTAYDKAYLDTLSAEAEAEALGVNFRISNDSGVTFGEIYKSPVTSPHGPLELRDGTLLWVGRTFSPDDSQMHGKDCIQAHKINIDGTTEFIGQIENIKLDEINPLSCEPHAILLDDGRILVQIRAEKVFSIYQSISEDNGKTWSRPERILPLDGGAPPHIFKHSSGALISTYSYRKAPYGIKAMFSFDNGNTWDYGHDIYVNNISSDLGYPSSVELEDGSILTVFYARSGKAGFEMGVPCEIYQTIWKLED